MGSAGAHNLVPDGAETAYVGREVAVRHHIGTIAHMAGEAACVAYAVGPFETASGAYPDASVKAQNSVKAQF